MGNWKLINNQRARVWKSIPSTINVLFFTSDNMAFAAAPVQAATAAKPFNQANLDAAISRSGYQAHADGLAQKGMSDKVDTVTRDDYNAYNALVIASGSHNATVMQAYADEQEITAIDAADAAAVVADAQAVKAAQDALAAAMNADPQVPATVQAAQAALNTATAKALQDGATKIADDAKAAAATKALADAKAAAMARKAAMANQVKQANSVKGGKVGLQRSGMANMG